MSVRFPFPERPIIEAQADAWGLSLEGVEQLFAIDRLLRGAVADGVLENYALSGPAALLGIYLRPDRPLRVPDELSLARIGQHHADDDAALSVLAMALPEGEVVDDDDGRRAIRYQGVIGPAMVPIRFEPKPAFDLPAAIRGVRSRYPGVIDDPRLGYHSLVGSTIAVPVLTAEEVLARTLIAIATNNRPDRPFRVDDFRLALALDLGATKDAISGPIRAFLAGSLRGTNDADTRARLATFSAVVVDACRRNDHPEAIPAWYRPAGAYEPDDRRLFELQLERLPEWLR
jgi:hypothetical protein